MHYTPVSGDCWSRPYSLLPSPEAARYNRWQNEIFYAVVDTLPEDG
jgi:hypothetical protein